jgi:tetratricopeptide (TPR) repeat protein
MATISEALAIAVQHHQAGRLQAAEQIYRQVLSVEPNQADAWHLLGVVAHQMGKHEVAVGYIRRAIQLTGTEAAFHVNLGNALNSQGKLDEAIVCFRHALGLKPDFVEAHNNLGTALQDQGRLDEAAACYRRAIELDPHYAEAYNNLGSALKDKGKLVEAVDSCRQALQLKPDFAQAHYNLGLALQKQGRLDEAVACYRHTLDLTPQHADAHFDLGNALQQQGNLDEAVACYRRALELKPDFAPTHNNLGTALKKLGKLDDAIACYRRALELWPGCVEAHNNLGLVFQDRGRLDESVACYRRALQLSPGFADAYHNLGVAFQNQGKLDDAVACYRRAIELKPDLVGVHNNLGTALQDLGKLDDAMASYRRALELKPDFADAHLNLALAWLLAGDWQRGWPEYQWRWRTKSLTPRCFSQPLWNGESLAGKTILFHAEQGLGDTIQFIRFASIAKQRGGTVILECQKSLLGLLEGCPDVDQLVGQGDDLPAFDVHAPLLSLPGILKTSLETIPARIPYLLPEPAMLQEWRKKLIGFDGFKIGISWQGSRTFRGDRFRSIPLRCFAPLAQIPGVHLISLQKGAGSEQLAEVRDLFPVTELGSRLQDLTDTAAVMKNLDLVITSDTAPAHLAGALGVPVWVALSFAADWRWLLDRCDSPWYPTMRLFRQKERGNWQGVFEEIKKALCQRLQASRADGTN